MARAQTITIISVNEAEIPEEVSAATLVAHLARRGFTARIERMNADRADIQPTILSVAADADLDLIVMGGYGHSAPERAHPGWRHARHAANHDRADADVTLTPVSTTAPQSSKRIGGLRRRIYAVLEQGDGTGGVSLALNRFLIVLIVVTLAGTVVESVPDLAMTYAVPLSAIEWAATLVFSLEYAARLWSAAEHPLLKRRRIFWPAPLRAEFSGIGRSCSHPAVLAERFYCF